MPRRIHLIGGVLALLCIATFFFATIVLELLGSHVAVAKLKSLIVAPGLWILIPSLAATGGSGLFLSQSRRGRLIDAKKRRMPFIAANGLLVLVPCAICLGRWTAADSFGGAFYPVQALELMAGATNLALLGLNFRDGLRLTGRFRASTSIAAPPPRGD